MIEHDDHPFFFFCFSFLSTVVIMRKDRISSDDTKFSIVIDFQYLCEQLYFHHRYQKEKEYRIAVSTSNDATMIATRLRSIISINLQK